MKHVKPLTSDIKPSIFLQAMHRIFLELKQNLRNGRIRKRGLKYADRLARTRTEIKLDLGCGCSSRPGFVGVDLNKEADLQWNIHWGLPFADDSIKEIRSDHFVEHLELTDVIGVFSECHRVLVQSGALDFSVPHLDPYIDAYLRRDYQFLSEKINDIPKGQEDLYSTCFDRISWLLYRAGEHKSLFDRDSIIAKLRLAGFSNLRIRAFDPNRDINWRFSSIYVVAVK